MCDAEDMAIKAPKMQGAVHHQSTRQLLLTTVFASFGCASLADWSLAEKGPRITRESPQATGFWLNRAQHLPNEHSWTTGDTVWR